MQQKRGIIAIASFLRERSKIIQRECRTSYGPQRQGQECAFIIITTDAVGAQNAATRAPMDDGPFAIAANFDTDRLHGRLTGTAAIADLFIEVSRPKTSGAVIAMVRAKGFGRNVDATGDAGKGLIDARFIRHVKHAVIAWQAK
jgi:hypothetical protein